MTKKKSPRMLGSIISDVCRKIGMTEAYEEYQTLKIWESIVGDTISRVTTVEKMKDGDLFVKVNNPSWRMELNYRKRDIVSRMNKAIGYNMIRTIIFK
jgi:predicted nucleic acid-binding Zn ribbon protein